MGFDQADVIKCVSLCTLFIYLKFFATCTLQGGHRTRAAEDGGIAQRNAEKLKATAGGDFDEEKRWERIVLNDLENVLFGTILMWASLIAMGDKTVTIIFSILFVVFRYAHTICYVYELMPWRSICWVVAVVANIGLAINSVIGAFDSDNPWNV